MISKLFLKANRPIVALIVALTFVLSSVTAFSAGPIPRKPGPTDKCPVCGMFVYKFPNFLAQIVFNDGSLLHFDGVKDMMKYTLNIHKRHDGKKSSDIAAMYVTDYYSLEPIDGTKAFFVQGSNVYGPMGKELVPFETEEDANEFMTDHSGKAVLDFHSISAEIIKSLE